MSRTFALFGMAILVTSCLELTKPRDIERTTFRAAAPTPEVSVRPTPAVEPEAEPPPTEKM